MNGNRVEFQNFSKYLVQQRELRGFTTEEVASGTRISLNMIQALEGGQIERLPSQVFIANYVRAYANVIGLSPDDTVLQLEEVFRDSAGNLAASQKETMGRFRGRWGFGLLMLVILVAVLKWLGVTEINALRILSGESP